VTGRKRAAGTHACAGAQPSVERARLSPRLPQL